jgi:hypothetical protein
MFPRRLSLNILLFPAAAILAGCAAAATAQPQIQGLQANSSNGIMPINVSADESRKEADSHPDTETGGLAPLPTMADPVVGETAPSGGGAAAAPLIIKQAEIRLQVKDTDQAIDRLTQIVSDSRGYIVSNRLWYETVRKESYQYATYTIAVPVEMFESVLRRLRGLAVKVVDETASGQDVTEEYTDLESRLRNLEATRDRIRSFLAQAETVEESLRINQELAAIEEQIEQVVGRMRFLSGRAAFSTITIQIDPEIPFVPTAIPTPTPTPTPSVWDPGRTFDRAGGLAIRAGQFLVDMFIYLVVWVPFAVPFAIVWFIYKLITRKRETKPS